MIYRVLTFFGGTGKYSISWQHKHNHFISSKHTETITSIASMPNCRSPYTVLQGPLWFNVLTMCFYCYGERQRVDCHMPPAALASMAVLCLSKTWKHSWESSNSILWENKKKTECCRSRICVGVKVLLVLQYMPGKEMVNSNNESLSRLIFIPWSFSETFTYMVLILENSFTFMRLPPRSVSIFKARDAHIYAWWQQY